MADFLFEIGLEEVPARMIAGAEAELLRRTLAMLGKEALLGDGFDPLTDAKSFSTPRRLAVLVRGVREQQGDVTEEVTGPAVKIAFKDGVPTPAADAFAKKSGVSVSELRKIQTPKGEYLAATSVKKGRSADEVVASELPKEIAAIYWAKSMYWRAGKPERFVRPVQWMVCLLGESVVPVEFGGKTAGRATYGHRILFGSEPIELPNLDDYVEVLRDAFVEADVEVRRESIRKALDRTRRGIEGARWREDEPLVDKLTHLTEWPSVILGNFEEAYLVLPEEVLVTVMRDHQNYFAVEGKDGKLLPHFLAVLNTELLKDGRDLVRQGNERVLRARFNDARFFWEFDQRVPLVERRELLHSITFQKQLGTYSQKLPRLEEIWGRLIHRIPEPQYLQSLPVIPGVDEVALKQATELCKSDLTCDLVKEFTELQGIIGGLYAEHQGFGKPVKDAIYYQYNPRSMDDTIPPTIEGCLLSIADRSDTIAGMFALGLEPSGSRDPFALRRAANGIIKIIAECSVEISRSLRFIAESAIAPYGSKIAYFEDSGQSTSSFESVGRVEIPIDRETVSEKIHIFLRERLEFYLRESKGQAYDIVKAVLADGGDDVRDAIARTMAVSSMRGSDDFLAVCAAFKRMKNILIQADETGVTSIPVEMPAHVEMHPSQNALNNGVSQISARFAGLCDSKHYVDALKLLATLRPQIDMFLDPKTGVKVMDDVPYVRETRLNLLRQILKNFSRVADFAEIVVVS